MEEKGKDKFLFDTSALLSLQLGGLLNVLVRKITVVITYSVLEELHEFSKHDDRNGRAAKSIIKLKNKFELRKSSAKHKIKYLQETDNELYTLSKEEYLNLITDDTKIHAHCRDIEIYFSTFFLFYLIGSGKLNKSQALASLEKMRNLRNWQNNIIYLQTKEDLDKV